MSVARESGNAEKAFYGLRNCIWKCDDVQDELAVEMRKRLLNWQTNLLKEILKIRKSSSL